MNILLPLVVYVFENSAGAARALKTLLEALGHEVHCFAGVMTDPTDGIVHPVTELFPVCLHRDVYVDATAMFLKDADVVLMDDNLEGWFRGSSREMRTATARLRIPVIPIGSHSESNVVMGSDNPDRLKEDLIAGLRQGSIDFRELVALQMSRMPELACA